MSFQAMQQVARATHHPNERSITAGERAVLTVLADLHPAFPEPEVVGRLCGLSAKAAAEQIGTLLRTGAISFNAPGDRQCTFHFASSQTTLPALTRLVEAARAWHDFHAHAPSMIQCDAICAALPEAEVELLLAVQA